MCCLVVFNYQPEQQINALLSFPELLRLSLQPTTQEWAGCLQWVLLYGHLLIVMWVSGKGSDLFTHFQNLELGLGISYHMTYILSKLIQNLHLPLSLVILRFKKINHYWLYAAVVSPFPTTSEAVMT